MSYYYAELQTPGRIVDSAAVAFSAGSRRAGEIQKQERIRREALESRTRALANLACVLVKKPKTDAGYPRAVPHEVNRAIMTE
ncbi:MAG: hypothetical protein A2758_03140 [Candidatus Zambryskibacteria bacterium RIFCSPHIGHO2_01_FULL_49_18]|uniref:Uncharacterized protein n=2 Tax=Parcubacteria group TaxID=1794811 RepID=A0A1G2T3B1_9BACT|nr:MAG: hypothetical protein A2941_02255 [Candidatus Yanofskybacteria bacterium RIFCSPLOWO2_01_FULL_49_17]OHA91775.1 MAG: hypothetical protein A2758_03140 [Candidatus Zambryskibacteria bacterium RIFCSPHIGHO2_01_FULL_49_18]